MGRESLEYWDGGVSSGACRAPFIGLLSRQQGHLVSQDVLQRDPLAALLRLRMYAPGRQDKSKQAHQGAGIVIILEKGSPREDCFELNLLDLCGSIIAGRQGRRHHTMKM